MVDYCFADREDNLVIKFPIYGGDTVNGGTRTIIITVINMIGIVCLIYFAVPYITHDVTLSIRTAMLPAETWNLAGVLLKIYQKNQLLS